MRFTAIAGIPATSNYVALLDRVAYLNQRALTGEMKIPGHRTVGMFDEDVILLKVNAVAVGVIFLNSNDDTSAGSDNRRTDWHSDVDSIKSDASIPASVMARGSNDFV